MNLPWIGIVGVSTVLGFGAGWGSGPVLDAVVTPCIWNIQVVDGDTLKCHGQLLRIEGFDTPETFRPLCPREREQGEKAKRRLTELEQHFDSLPRKTGSNGGYGRGETRAFVGGKSVGEILVAEGLAVKSNRSSKKHNWCVPIVRI